MLSKNEAKYIQSFSHKKQRAQSGLFIAEGIKLVNELLHSDFKVKKVFATDDWENDRIGNVELIRVTEDELQKISSLQTANKVLALVEQPVLELTQIFSKKIVLALDGIQDPGNLGTIIRIADWFGINTIVAGIDTVDCFNPKVVQSTMGSIIRVKVYYTELNEWLKTVKIPVYGALLSGESVYNTPKIDEGILVIGNESKGIHENILPCITHPVSIPRVGQAESLNAAVATGILLSHLIHPKVI